VNEPAIKLTTYFAERERVGERFLADALIDLYARHGVRASVLLRGIESFGEHHELRTDRLLTLSESLPAVSIAVDARERIELASREVLALSGNALTTLERARLLTDGELTTGAPAARSDDTVKLSFYGGRSVRAGGEAGYVAAIEALRAGGAAAASVLLAVDGTLHGQRRRARFFARNADVPLVVLALGQRSALLPVMAQVAQLLDDPVATVERVQLCKSAGTLLSEPAPVAGHDPSGLPIWQKLTVHVQEQAQLDGHPLHVELVRRLRAAGAAGATVLRGVRGFYGHHDPYADRVLSLRRNVPVQIIAIDAPTAVRRWWPVLDRATRRHGLVTSELVPASHGPAGGAARGLARTPTAEFD
jgi:PII-like signaling protein